MKKILRLYRNWRYRRLYRRLFWFYAKHGNLTSAAEDASSAFVWFCGFEYADLFRDRRKPDV